MDNGKKFLSDVGIIQKARDTKKLVVFVGSGVSVNSNIPNWGDMLEEIKRDIGIDRSDTEDALQIAQIYFNERKQKEYIDKIRTTLHHKKKKYNPIDEAIFDLQPEHILTTNYDDLLEQVIKNRALPFSVVKKDSDFPYVANSNLLVKIHGDLDEDDFVLKEDDYIDYEFNHPLFEAFIKSIFSTKVVLFVGYSFSDINLKLILQKVRNILGKNYQNSYFITHSSYSSFKVNYLREKGVNVLSYKDNENYINLYLGGDNARKIDFKKNSSSLNITGQNLLSILTFLNVYNRFEEDLREYEYVKQMKMSLERFSELGTLPYFFIANLYPFNNTSEKVFYNEHDVYSLSIKNKELVEFLENSVELKDGYIDFKKDYISKINNEDELKKNKDSLIYVTDVLNYSAINTIKFEDFRNFPKKVLLYNTIRRDCECFTCLIGELKLDKLIDKLLITDITDASDLQEDAMLAYSHYKCGNIYQSYNLFEEIAQKAWHTGKYVVYFICKFNLKRLGHIIHWKEYKNLSGDLIQEISSKAEKIDLDAVYRHTNEISKEEAQLMKIIRDNEILDKASGYVADEYEKIKQIRASLDNGSSTTASRSEHVIDFHLITVDMFYNRNFIVNDVFSEYIDMYNTGVKALLLNYANYRDYSQEQISLDYEFCFYFIYYGKYSELKNTIAEYKIKDLHLDVESEEKVYHIIVNYYKSFIGNSGAFGRHEVNHKIYNQINKSSFDYKFVDIFDNISLLLGIVDFGKDKFKIIGENLLNALKYTDIFHPSNVINLEYVFIGNAEYIDNEFGQSLLEILCDKPKLFTKEILDYVVHAFIDKDDSKKINNLDLINAIIETLESRSREVHSKTVSYLERIYKIVSNEHKQVIVDKAMDRLRKEFSNREYWDYVMNSIIKYDTFFDKYLENILANSYQIHSYKFDYLFVGKKRTKPDMHFEFINFIRLLYKFDLLEKYNDVKDSFVDLRDYMIFYLNPEKFDCENFKVEWLFCTYEPSVHRALSKISFVKSAFDSFIKEKKGAEYLELYTEYYL